MVSAMSAQLAPPQTVQRPAVQVKELHKIYRIGPVPYPALKGVSFEIKKGELVSIVGPSGSGKSTLLNLIGALDKPTAGKIYIDGIDISKLNEYQLSKLRNRKIGFVYQFFNLIQRLTAVENVELPLIAQGMSQSKRRELALKMLHAVGLIRMADKRPVELSGGEQQRVAIARALVTKPAIILGDEPTGNVDTKTAQDVINVIKRINRELHSTFILVTHNLEVANSTERIFKIRDGYLEGIDINPMFDSDNTY